jgi:predicted dehydrogenase
MAKNHGNHKRRVARREFLRTSVAAVGAAAAPRPRRADARVLGANDRIRLGLIGCGDCGLNYHVPKALELSRDPQWNVELSAVCDIYEPRKQAAQARSRARVFHDYRDMLEGDIVDGVIIATPDHWHHQMAMDAMQAGKDVHVEKPMALYWEQAKEMHRAAQRLRRIVQVGAGATSHDIWWQARKAIREGALGKVVWVSGGLHRNNPEGDWNYRIDPGCSPQNLDWERFLGPAPRRPFDPERYFRYRKYWDYSGGLAHDLIVHLLSCLQICLGAEFPLRVSAGGGVYRHYDRETPDTFQITVEYPSRYMATLASTQTTERGIETAIRGEKATLTFEGGSDGGTRAFITPEPAFAQEVEKRTIEAESRMGHEENFIHCMRTREQPHCDSLTGYKVMVVLGLAVRSWREGRMFTFDPDKQQIANDASGNAMTR